MQKNVKNHTLTVFVSAAMFLIVAQAYAEAPPTAEADKPVVEQIVNTLTKLSGGPHAGFRANHAKGIVALGEFTPAKSAASITKAEHLQKTSSPVTVRFSDATGVPNIPDADGNAFPKGIAIRFNLPDGSYTDIVSISTNGFPAANPEDFLGLLNAIATSGPEAVKPTPVEQFLGSHPAALKFVQMPKLPPVSFATQSFFGVNAFKFINAKGETQYGRYRITPIKGAQFLSKAEAAKVTPNYLFEELPKRLAKAPASYKLSVQLAKKGDVLNDATVVWPESRKQVELGTLVIKTIDADGVKYEKSTMFNPLNLVDGIEASEDPILLARPSAYAVSFGRRLGK
ncbi:MULTISPECIES: catalase family peroxidase [Methylotenera]|uniref:catalase family peroxidase n=1 Tax=Methylotenera TaxID=359407 RepID=UPI00036722F8|nr:MULTISPECIES: catalase family peroxidase [Methylotenera]